MDAGNLSEQVKLILQEKGFPLISLRECGEDFSSFSKALESAVDYNEYGPYVDKHTPEDLLKTRARAFLSRDEMAGVVVWPDGNIGAVFKDKRSANRNAIGEIMLTAISVGGNKLDCYDGFLSKLYSLFGFVPVARVRFDRRFAPPNWQEELKEPDVVFWMHCGDPVETVAENIARYPLYLKSDIANLPCFDSYEEAYQYRDVKQQTGKP